MKAQSSLISVAPMMNYTDKHNRYLMRLLAPDIFLYTEMITASALIYGNRQDLLTYDHAEHPVALQLGGSDRDLLAQAAKLGADFGYDEINLNVGCPSDRVSKGRFGACLMKEPALVANCIAAMQEKVTIPITVKCRIGVDDADSEDYLHAFISKIANAGCQKFIIHARKAWLKGLSPKQNREIPPLRYELVYQLKKAFPALQIILNGGIKKLEEIETHLKYVDGVMIGRASYQQPYFLAEIAAHYFPQRMILSREEVLAAFIPYINQQLQKGVKLNTMTRHILELFKGQRGAGIWRRYLTENTYQLKATAEVIVDALREKEKCSLHG